MKAYSERMARLVKALSRLPSIGHKTAERIVFYLLKTRADEVEELTSLIKGVKENTFFCELCHNFSDQKLCHICADPGRDHSLVCVVEDPKDVAAIEKTGSYVGIYYVLLGVLSALEGVGPDQIEIRGLVERVKKENIREIILATNPNTEGETTALYLARVLKTPKIKITRIAHGIPVGSHIEFADQATLARALAGRAAF